MGNIWIITTGALLSLYLLLRIKGTSRRRSVIEDREERSRPIHQSIDKMDLFRQSYGYMSRFGMEILRYGKLEGGGEIIEIQVPQEFADKLPDSFLGAKVEKKIL